LTNRRIESVAVVHIIAVVKTEYLFVNVCLKVRWIDADIRSLQATL
jgi:hypothetical protein